MAENSQLPLALPQSPQTPRRGRPRGSGNRRSSDLAKYVAARFGGMTPGQQAAELCMVTARELREAKADLRAQGVTSLSPMALAMARRASALAVQLGCEARDAMAILIKAQAELMPYVHQKQAPKSDDKAAAPATVYMVPDGDGSALPAVPDLSDEGQDETIDFIELVQPRADQVS